MNLCGCDDPILGKRKGRGEEEEGGGIGLLMHFIVISFCVFCFFLQPGGKCMILPTVSQEDAAKLFPKGYDLVSVPSGKQYIRLTPQPE